MNKRILSAIIMVCWAVVSISQNDVGIGTNNPAARLDVRGNGIGYDVFNASNDLSGPLDSIMSLTSRGNLGIGTSNIGTYKLLSLGSTSAFSPQIEVWNGNPNVPGSMMLGDLNDVGGFNGGLNLYLAGSQNVSILAGGNSYLNGGFLGVGNNNPMEQLHLNGAAIVGKHIQLPGSEVPGTIEWSGLNFRGFDGTNWIPLDVVWDGDWNIAPGIGGPPIPTLYNIFPGPVAVSLPAYVPPIPIIDYAYLYVNNNMPPGPGQFSNQLLLDDITGGLNSSQGFLITNWQGLGNMQYSQGIFNADRAFKVTKSGTLLPTTQGDGVTMVRYNQTGITDLPNQSRVRAYQTDPMAGQLIQPGIWTPVNFNFDAPLSPGYDQQNEFITAAKVQAAAPPENAFFTATEEGYYQVNARCEFKTDSYSEDGYDWIPVSVNPPSYVSIAIYAGPSPGQTFCYAEGNKLQIAFSYSYMYYTPQGDLVVVMETKILENNNAPNVGDVVHLNKNDIISIWVFQSANTPMNLIPGHEKLYVSIHKVS